MILFVRRRPRLALLPPVPLPPGAWPVDLPMGMTVAPVRGQFTPLGTAWQPGALNLADYPNVVPVAAGDSTALQNAINSAPRGTRVVLPNNSEFVTTIGFDLPAKAGSGGVLICSEAISTGAFPRAAANYNQRVRAADAGAMARIRVTGSGEAAAFRSRQTVSSAWRDVRGWRFAGLDITDNETNRPSTLALEFESITPQAGHVRYATALDEPSEIIWDRCRFRSLRTTFGAGQGAVFGVTLFGRRNAVVACSIENIREIGGETKAILVTHGSGQHYVDNVFGESLVCGYFTGGFSLRDPSLRSDDLIIRRSHFTRPVAWLDQPQIKNNFELKLGRRVFAEGLVLSNHRPRAQLHVLTNYSVNQDGTGDGAAHIVSDVTMRYIKLDNVGRLIRLFPGQSFGGDPNAFSPMGRAVYEHFLGLGGDTVPQVGIAPGMGGIQRLRNWTTTRRLGTENFMDIDAQLPAVNHDFTFENSISEGWVRSASGNGLAQLVANGQILAEQFAGTLRVEDNGGAVAGTIQAANRAAVGYVDAAGGNHRLTSGSPGRLAGTDGFDVGCDIDGLDALTAGCISGDWT